MTSPLEIVLTELMHNPSTTFELRAKGVCSPASAIYRLKKRGYSIKRTLLSCYDDAGVLHHRVALYRLENHAQHNSLAITNTVTQKQQHFCHYQQSRPS